MNALQTAVVCAGMLAWRLHSALAAPLASAPLTTEPSGIVDVTVQMAGHPANLRVDTGSYTSVLTETGANRLGLSRDHVSYREIMVIFSTRVTEYAIANSIRFDTFDAPGAKFLIVPDRFMPVELAGQLGADILRNYDVEFDYRHGKLNLYAPGQCASIWPAGAATQLPLDVSARGLLDIDVQLDGKPVTAILSTGMPSSVISFSATQDMFDFSSKTPGLGVLATDHGLVYLMSYPFKTLSLHDAVVANPDIEIDTRFRRRPPLLLGASVLRQLHFCIGYSTSTLYVATGETH